MTERVIAPERLDFIDVVTSSHNHTDHLDRDTLAPSNAALVRQVADLCADFGRPVATAPQARQLLGLTR